MKKLHLCLISTLLAASMHAQSIDYTKGLSIWFDNPRPLPSVLLDTSPRMNRSVSSEAGMFSGRADIFFRLKHAMPSFFSRSA